MLLTYLCTCACVGALIYITIFNNFQIDSTIFLDSGGVGVVDPLIFSSWHYSFWSSCTKVDPSTEF